MHSLRDYRGNGKKKKLLLAFRRRGRKESKGGKAVCSLLGEGNLWRKLIVFLVVMG